MSLSDIICGMVIASALLAGCATFRAPVIIDISDSKVVVEKVIQVGFSRNTASLKDIQKEADKGCGQYNKKAVLLSEVCRQELPTPYGSVCMVINYLFSCNEKEKKK